jgi:hypothetical protein
LTTEQLNQARTQAWHQAGNPLLTADDASAWLRETGVSLFLPRAQQLATAAPSFVEAVLGASNPTPALDQIEAATRLLHRLLAAGEVIALNLLNTPGEQPDFLATPETLPFLFALIGDKEWKRGPRGKSSPLVIEVWKLLDREGPLTAIEVKEQLGRQLTEAAALRALTELWSHLRIEPVFREGEPAAWQLLERNHLKQMQAGSTMSQAVALSALVSLYLQSAVAASGDEIEVFLSPLASRSKIRDVVKGLTATRQLGTLNLGPVEMYHLEGSLPEFAETASPEGLVVEATSPAVEAEIGEGRKRFVAKRLAAEAGEPATAERPSHAPRKIFERPPASGGDRKPYGGGSSPDRRPFAPRPGTTGGERRPYGMRAPGGANFNPREPWKEDQKPAARRDEISDRKPFAASSPDGAAPRRPFPPREGERKSFAPRAGDRPFKPRSDAKPFSDRENFGDRKPFAARADGDRKPFTPRDGERKSFAPRTGDRPFKPRSDAKPFSERKSFGDRKPFAPRSADGERKPYPPRDRKPFAPRAEGDRKPFNPREGERKSFAPRTGDRPFKPRSDAKPFGERKSFGDRKPFAPRRDGERKPFTPRDGERKSFAPRTGDRPFKPRSDAKPFGERKSFTPRAGSADRKPFTPRGEGKPFAPRGGDRPSKPRSTPRPDFPKSAERPAGAPARPSSLGARKPTGFRKPTSPTRARTSPFTSTGKPRTGFKPPVGRPGPRATRPAGRPATPGARPPRAAGARGGFKRVGRPGKGRSK